MKYLIPIDITVDKMFAVFSISLIENLGHRIKFNIIDVLFLNTNLDWINYIANTKNIEEIKKMFENDVYSSYDVKNEQDIIESVFNGYI